MYCFSVHHRYTKQQIVLYIKGLLIQRYDTPHNNHHEILQKGNYYEIGLLRGL